MLDCISQILINGVLDLQSKALLSSFFSFSPALIQPYPQNRSEALQLYVFNVNTPDAEY